MSLYFKPETISSDPEEMKAVQSIFAIHSGRSDNPIINLRPFPMDWLKVASRIYRATSRAKGSTKKGFNHSNFYNDVNPQIYIEQALDTHPGENKSRLKSNNAVLSATDQIRNLAAAHMRMNVKTRTYNKVDRKPVHFSYASRVLIRLYLIEWYKNFFRVNDAPKEETIIALLIEDLLPEIDPQLLRRSYFPDTERSYACMLPPVLIDRLSNYAVKNHITVKRTLDTLITIAAAGAYTVNLAKDRNLKIRKFFEEG